MRTTDCVGTVLNTRRKFYTKDISSILAEAAVAAAAAVYDMIYLTFRRLMLYIYGAPILDVSRSHTTT